MEEILKTISTPVFWVCSVLFAIVGGVIVNYVQRGLDRAFSGWSKSRRAKAELASALFQEDLRVLHRHRTLIPLYIAQESRDRFEACQWLFVALLLTGASFGVLLRSGPTVSPMQLGLVLVGVTLAASYFRRAHRCMRCALHQAWALQAIYDSDLEQAARMDEQEGRDSAVQKPAERIGLT